MHKLIKLMLLISTTCLPSLANADMSSAKLVFKSGNWSVLRDVDLMTDKTSCTGIYKDEKGIQLTDNTLYITVRGGLKSITLRYGEEPAEPMRLPTDSEKSIDAVSISGDDFIKLLNSDRLRLQSLTLVRGVASFDLNLDGIVAAHENIMQGCPGQPLSTKTKQKVPVCSDGVHARLRERKVSKDIIDYACSPR